MAVMFLEDLVEAGEVEVDVLLKLKKVLSDLFYSLLEVRQLFGIDNRVLHVMEKLAGHLDLLLKVLVT